MNLKKRQEGRALAKSHINPSLRRNLRIFFVISLILLGVVIYEAVTSHASPWQVILGLLAGIAFGIIFARMYKISWDEDAQHVSSNIDIFGAVVLLMYIAFDLSRETIVHIFTYSESVGAISWALLAGAMYGRVIGSGRVIIKILQDQKVFSRRKKL